MARAKSGGTKKTKTTPARSSTAKAVGKKKAAAASEEPEGPGVADRRSKQDRRGADRRKKSVPVAIERREIERRVKVNRRRQIDPTTCERDYSDEEIEFMNALDDYKRASGRMFPTCSEILEVIKGLGYQKSHETEPAAPAASEAASDPHGEAELRPEGERVPDVQGAAV